MLHSFRARTFAARTLAALFGQDGEFVPVVQAHPFASGKKRRAAMQARQDNAARRHRVREEEFIMAVIL